MGERKNPIIKTDNWIIRDAMNDDMVVFRAHDNNDFLSRDETPLIIRDRGG